MSTLKWLGNLFVKLVQTPLTHLLAYWIGKRSGRKDAEVDQRREDLDAIHDAERARRNVKHDSDSVRKDPFNRDI